MRQLDGMYKVVGEHDGRVPGVSEASESRLLNEPYGLLSSSSHMAPSCSVYVEEVGKVGKDRCRLLAAMEVCLGKLRVAPASNLRPTGGQSSAITYVTAKPCQDPGPRLPFPVLVC